MDTTQPSPLPPPSLPPPSSSLTAATTTITTTTPALRKIEFHLARKPVSFSPNINPSFKLENLNPNNNNSSSSNRTGFALTRSSSSSSRSNDPSDFFEDAVLAFRMPPRRIGAGLENLGNTCFLNSVLQCLTYTEPLVGYLQSGKHQITCRVTGFCALCAIHKHVSRVLQAPGSILAPKDLVSNLRCISRNFRNARQEDAHEYMIHLLESMHKCCLPSGVPAESPSAYEKSLVHRIFGGCLRSQVKCLQCSYCSDTFDPFLDLSLEIAKTDSLYKALRHFTAPEQLDGGERQYKCERCKKKVRALKQLTVSRAPYVLTIHLKRFRHLSGQKIDKKVQFGSTLDLKPFFTGDHEGDLTYTLYGVLVHAGWSTHSGHYYSFVRTSSGVWYSLDDNRVYQVSEKVVMEQKAYMLFYVRDRKSFVMKKAMNVMQKENFITTLRKTPMLVVDSTSKSNTVATIAATTVVKQLKTPSVSKVDATEVIPSSAVKHLNSKLSEVLVQPNLSRRSTESSVSISESSSLPKGNVDQVVEAVTNSSEDSHVRNGDKSKVAGASIDSKIIPESDPLVLDDGLSLGDRQSSIADGVGDFASDMGVKPSRTAQSDLTIQRSSESEAFSSSKISKSKRERQHVDTSVSLKILSKRGGMKKISKSPVVGMHLSTRMLYGAAFLNMRKRKKQCKQMNEVALCENKADQQIGTSTSYSVASTSARSSCSVVNSTDHSKTIGDFCFGVGKKDAAKISLINSTCNLPQEPISEEANYKQSGLIKLGEQHSQPQDEIVKESAVGSWGGMKSPSEDAKENGSELIIGHVLDEWDVEYDRGKRKKVRGLKTNFDGPNVFQEVATKKAKLKGKTAQRNFVNEPVRI